jgi:hypothetical protein
LTPTEISTAARNRYNAVGDSFFSDSELLLLMFDACNQLAKECGVIKRTYTTSTVASQHEYSKPTNTISLKRITYNGQKLKPITMRDDDAITGLNQSSTSEGTPAYYYEWDDSIFLRPIPAEVGTLKIFSQNSHQAISASSTLEVDEIYHMDIVHYIVSEMCAKDKNFEMARWYLEKWDKAKADCMAFERKKLRGDSFASVQAEESSIEGYMGIV